MDGECVFYHDATEVASSSNQYLMAPGGTILMHCIIPAASTGSWLVIIRLAVLHGKIKAECCLRGGAGGLGARDACAKSMVF